MRTAGVLDELDVGAGSHICWSFDTDEEFQAAARAFLAEGARRGEKLLYVAPGAAAELQEMLRAAGFGRPLADGQLVAQSVGELYRPGGRFDSAAQVHAYSRLVDKALADGYRGLRVACDATVLVSGDEAHRNFVRYELAVDRLIAEGSMAALCAYRSSAVGPRVADLVGVHPLCNTIDPAHGSFRSFFDAGTLRLVGEADISTVSVVDAVVAVLDDHANDVREIDLSELQFVDVRSIVRVSRAMEQRRAGGYDIAVRGASELVLRLAERLDLKTLVEEIRPCASPTPPPRTSNTTPSSIRPTTST